MFGPQARTLQRNKRLHLHLHLTLELHLHLSLKLNLHLSFNCGDGWGTMGWLHKQFSPIFSVLHLLLGLGELQAGLVPDIVFPPLFLSVLSSSSFH